MLCGQAVFPRLAKLSHINELRAGSMSAPRPCYVSYKSVLPGWFRRHKNRYYWPFLPIVLGFLPSFARLYLALFHLLNKQFPHTKSGFVKFVEMLSQLAGCQQIDVQHTPVRLEKIKPHSTKLAKWILLGRYAKFYATSWHHSGTIYTVLYISSCWITKFGSCRFLICVRALRFSTESKIIEKS